MSLDNPTFTHIEQANDDSEATVVVTEIDTTAKTISGTFDFILTRGAVPAGQDSSISVANGAFNKLPYGEEGDLVIEPSEEYFDAKIDGVDFLPLVIIGTPTTGKLTFGVTNGSGNSISLVVPDNVTVGEYDFETFGGTYSATYNEGTTVYESVDGKINITKHDTSAKYLEATFNFEAEIFVTGGSRKSITEGSIGVEY